MNRLHVSFGIITLILGIMMAMQYRTNSFMEQGISSDRIQDVQLEYSKLEKESIKMDNEINDLAAKLEKAKKGQLPAREAISEELEKGRVSAGLVSLAGQGIIISLDNPFSIDDNRISIIRDEDLLRLVNELKGAGAEAVSINDQRLISTSEVRMSGSFININLERVSVPYKIVAIGAPEKLKSALEINDGLLDYFRNLGIKVEVKTAKKVI
ncbi:MAG: DUF881 domain-containing protein, partial [Peptococcaceae bacterium]|nr:DUF881 domain-containing protein [Peptococcaceae bacterium]